MSDQPPAPLDPSHPDPLVPPIPPVTPDPADPPMPIPSVETVTEKLTDSVANERVSIRLVLNVCLARGVASRSESVPSDQVVDRVVVSNIALPASASATAAPVDDAQVNLPRFAH
jgi:hypothetical protein